MAEGARKRNRFRDCSETACSINSTRELEDTASFAMRTTVTFMFAANAWVNG
jgi:hypothetical protein